MVAGSPVVGYSPTTGVSAGLAGNVAFYRGFPQTTRISSIVASATATSKAQFLVSAKFNVSSLENRWRLEADNRFFWTSQPTYGLGTSSLEDAKLDMKFNHFRIVDKYYKQVRRNIFLGAGYVYNIHNNVRPPDEVDPDVFADSPYITYSEQHGFDLDSQTSAGFSLHTLLDSRDGAINPSRGWYANASYLMLIDDFLGGDSTWQQFSYDLRTYARLSRDGRHKLAFWTFGDLVTGGDGAVPRPSLDRRRHLRALRARLSPGALPRREDAVRRGGVPLDHHEERPLRHGGLRQHGDAEQRAGEREAVRLVRDRGRLRLPLHAQQALEDEPLHRHRLR